MKAQLAIYIYQHFYFVIAMYILGTCMAAHSFFRVSKMCGEFLRKSINGNDFVYKQMQIEDRVIDLHQKKIDSLDDAQAAFVSDIDFTSIPKCKELIELAKAIGRKQGMMNAFHAYQDTGKTFGEFKREYKKKQEKKNADKNTAQAQ